MLRTVLLRWAASLPLDLLQGLLCAGKGDMAKLFPRSVSFFLELVLNVMDPFIVLYCVSDQPEFLVVVFASLPVSVPI